MSTRITIDPVTRIEGHLRIDCEVKDGRVVKAWASGQMWRGIEKILIGRDPRDAWIFTQRICGVCTTVHAITSVRAVENAIDLEVPLNAQYIRNMIIAAHGIHDHIVHFYHLAALDWVDITSALKADPRKAAQLAESLSEWPGNSVHEMRRVQDKLKGFVASGQLGVFANHAWGHPEMRLPPEVNLIAVAHYLQALEYQRIANKIVSTLGSKTPHIQNLAVGGVANPINPDSQSTLTIERLMLIKAAIDRLHDFIHQVYLKDVAVVAAHYLDWAGHGSGVTHYLSVPDLPLDGKGTRFAMPGGYIRGADLEGGFTPIRSFGDAAFRDSVAEAARHAWYRDEGPLHPWEGRTEPQYTDFQDEGKYSWIKSPTFRGDPAQVGPLANVLCMYAAGHEGARRYVGELVQTVAALTGKDVPLSALHSTLGRHAGRVVRTAILYDNLVAQWRLLMDNIARGDHDTFNPPSFPKGEVRGFGFHEAPRGTLSHWVVIEDGKIRNYQCVVPTTWNAAPRNADDEPGPYEAALVGTPVRDPEQPLEVLRTVRSFDPCLACAVHLHDPATGRAVQVKVS
ncbi:nickel-dependent hydrogenase large subunit [Inmirania thermothiophila]|uniref:hydrogenase (acceptor) n=1 Tax=Inmirania thermothiophila TaxID=1750597 RepID=A0A3N1Y1Z2_9GAMM|nr:nickel-dependent hydrogenase large subunit [Inmirania thermothiophila]ROR32538.1 hydrogenase large subunit [Inmirania thermothiophila]